MGKINARMHLYKNADVQPDQVCFVYNDNLLLLLDKRLPTAAELGFTFLPTELIFHLRSGWAMPGRALSHKTPKNCEFHPLREALETMAVPLAQEAMLGAQLINWSETTMHCCRCGGKLTPSERETAKICEPCRVPYFPQLTPVVIVLVKRGRDLLLARGLPPRRHYSCVAGFVEPGETLEEAIRREVKEEVGVEVRNIRYFGSQPWPFPNNLMLAFTAEWVTGEIQCNPKEISDAGWFNKENLPDILPPKVSISRQMIDTALRS